MPELRPYFGPDDPEPTLLDPEPAALLEHVRVNASATAAAIDALQQGFGVLGQSGYLPGTYTPGIYQAVEWDNLPLNVSFRFEIDLAGNRFRVAAPGVWEFSWLLVLEHTESNQGREIRLRFTGDQGAGSATLTYGIGRNQPRTNLIGSVLLDTSTASPGEWFQLEIGDPNQDVVPTGDGLEGRLHAKQLSIVG